LVFFESQESIVKRGEELHKKNASGVNLEDANLVSKLFVLFNGMIYIMLECNLFYPDNVTLAIDYILLVLELKENISLLGCLCIGLEERTFYTCNSLINCFLRFDLHSIEW